MSSINVNQEAEYIASFTIMTKEQDETTLIKKVESVAIKHSSDTLKALDVEIYAISDGEFQIFLTVRYVNADAELEPGIVADKYGWEDSSNAYIRGLENTEDVESKINTFVEQICKDLTYETKDIELELDYIQNEDDIFAELATAYRTAEEY